MHGSRDLDKEVRAPSPSPHRDWYCLGARVRIDVRMCPFSTLQNSNHDVSSLHISLDRGRISCIPWASQLRATAFVSWARYFTDPRHPLFLSHSLTAQLDSAKEGHSRAEPTYEAPTWVSTLRDDPRWEAQIMASNDTGPGGVGQFKVLKTMPRRDEALDLLKRLHSLCKPIQKK